MVTTHIFIYQTYITYNMYIIMVTISNKKLPDLKKCIPENNFLNKNNSNVKN